MRSILLKIAKSMTYVLAYILEEFAGPLISCGVNNKYKYITVIRCLYKIGPLPFTVGSVFIEKIFLHFL